MANVEEAEPVIWPTNAPHYRPMLDDGLHIQRNLDVFSENLLADDTHITVLEEGGKANGLVERDLDGSNFVGALEEFHQEQKKKKSIFCLVNKYLFSASTALTPKDANKLQITKSDLIRLCSSLEIPLSFLLCLTQLHLPCGNGSCSTTSDELGKAKHHDIWYILPIRVQYKCNDRRQNHAASHAKNNQMDPLHFLHLQNVGVDVRSSHIAIFTRVYPGDGDHIALVFNFMDGRWSHAADEPKRRLHEVYQWLGGSETNSMKDHHLNFHFIYFTSAIRWWTNALSSVNEQLIAYESLLQDEIDGDNQATDIYSLVNRALHSIAAHLQRYNSELSYMTDILKVLRDHDKRCRDLSPDFTVDNCPDTASSFSQLSSCLAQIQTFQHELSDKLENILALLFNRISIANDRMMVVNGAKMHAILVATQEDAKISRQIAIQSRELSRDMKRDSVAMKTIAVTTMFFLPGTSFAALLAMPFFQQNAYLSHASKFWIWVICTVPATVAAFAFYSYWRKKEECKGQIVEIALE